MSEIRVFMRHARPMCAHGVRNWLTSMGFDVRSAILEGIPIDELEATGDAFAVEACRKAREEHDDGQ